MRAPLIAGLGLALCAPAAAAPGAGTTTSNRDFTGGGRGLAPGCAEAPPPLKLTTIVTGLDRPTLVATEPGDSSRLYILEQGGVVRVRTIAPPDADQALAASSLPVFLDLSAETHGKSEAGLLGLAFHPSFASNRRFFMVHSRRTPRATGLQEWKAPAKGAPEKVGVPFYSGACTGNHVGGTVAFGPDGLLYSSTGENCIEGKPAGGTHQAQDLGSLAGKILKVDVGKPGSPTVVHYGLRNPWRFSFDSLTHDLYVGDNGGSHEKILIRPFKSGVRNFGWAGDGQLADGVPEQARFCDSCTGQGGTACVACLGVTPAVATRVVGWGGIIGGHVYRGKKIRCLQGRYLYSLFTDANKVRKQPVASLVWTGSAVTAHVDLTKSLNPGLQLPLNPSSFGQDGNGELYIVHYGIAGGNDGAVYRIDPR